MRQPLLILLLTVLFAMAASAQGSCPKISVSGPAGKISNDMAVFSINADLPNLENLSYVWTVTAGKIDQGQGRPHLYVLTAAEDAGKRLKATVRVIGLPKDCPDTAVFDAGEVQPPGDLIMFDEYDASLTAKGELERLDLVAAEWKNDPSHYFYFIVYRGPRESLASVRARTKRIKNHLTLKRRMPSDKVVIVIAGVGPRLSTHVCRVPPDARHNIPKN